METTFIYALIDPNDNNIRYVGKTNDIKQRLRNHCNPARYRPTHKFNWIRKLRNEGSKPEIIILDEVSKEDWKFWEKYWICQIKSWGFSLTNYTDGGDGLTYGNQTSFRKGGIPWNIDKGNIKKCEVCDKEFKMNKAGKRSCSKKCGQILKSKAKNSGKFRKDSIPWNKNKKGYHFKNSWAIEQLSLDGEFIKEWENCSIAAKHFGCTTDNIRRAVLGYSKTARKYKWKYKNNKKK